MDTENSISKTKWGLSELYKFGKYQKRIMFLLALATFPNGLTTIMFVFIHDQPTHHCKPDPNISLAMTAAVNTSNSSLFYIPTELDAQGMEVPSSCLKFKSISNYTANGSDISGALRVVECDKGWVYDTEQNQATIVTEWDLVCGNAWIRPLMTTLNYFGFLIGSMISGVISDRFGRRPTLLFATFFQFIFLFIASFSPTIESYAVLIFSSGLTNLVNYQTGFVLEQYPILPQSILTRFPGTELVEPSKRAMMGFIINAAYSVGYMFLPGLAYLLPDWRWFLRVNGLLGVLFIPYFWLIPESPVWLIKAGKVKEAKEILEKIARVNKAAISVDAKNLMNSEKGDFEESTEVQQLSYLDLFRHRAIRCRSLCIFLCWFSSALQYYATSLNTGSLGGNKYVNCFISAAVELPALIAAYIMVQKLGRPVPLSMSYIFGNLLYGSLPLIMQVNQTAVLVSAMISKFLVTGTFLIIYIYTCELFPTMMRHKSISAASTMARFGGLTKLIPNNSSRHHIEQVHFSFPYIVMCVIGVLTGVFALWCLPETLNEPTPHTIDDALKLKRKQFISCCGENNGFNEEQDSDEVRT
ncbi:organic cation/carnitine transporter 2-like [Ciona intestinalis]